jgi:hypothetical protein
MFSNWKLRVATTALLLLVVGGLFAFVYRISDAQSFTVLKVVDFRGMPQWYGQENGPVIFNSGTLTLSLTLADDMTLADLDGGQMSFKNADGRVSKIQNMWQLQTDGSYLWVQYIPFDTVELWLAGAPVLSIEGYGPFAGNRDGNGLTKEEITVVDFTISQVQYQVAQGSSIWDWTLQATPDWAISQFPWMMKASLQTSCNGHADNHDGVFEWSFEARYVADGHGVGNGLSNEWVLQPLAPITMTLYMGGWSDDFIVSGPDCYTELPSGDLTPTPTPTTVPQPVCFLDVLYGSNYATVTYVSNLDVIKSEIRNASGQVVFTGNSASANTPTSLFHYNPTVGVEYTVWTQTLAPQVWNACTPSYTRGAATATPTQTMTPVATPSPTPTSVTVNCNFINISWNANMKVNVAVSFDQNTEGWGWYNQDHSIHKFDAFGTTAGAIVTFETDYRYGEVYFFGVIIDNKDQTCLTITAPQAPTPTATATPHIGLTPGTPVPPATATQTVTPSATPTTIIIPITPPASATPTLIPTATIVSQPSPFATVMQIRLPLVSR